MESTFASAWSTAVHPILDETRRRFGVSGLVVAAVRYPGSVATLTVGTDAAGPPLQADSLFPVASVTKLATALLMLRLVDAGAVALDGPLADYLPEARAAQPGVTMRRLLSHTSGLPTNPPLSESDPGITWPALAEACRATPLAWSPFTRVQYSNVGYGLLGLVAEAVTGEAFPTTLRRQVIVPLGLDGVLGQLPPRPVATVADVRGSGAGTPNEPFNSAAWRALGLPWSGLLTTAAGAVRLAHAFRGGDADYLAPTTAQGAIQNQTDDLAGGWVPPLLWRPCWWGLGPDLHDSKLPFWAPTQASPGTYGHAGASGCAVWEDPVADVAWAILGTRTADNGWLLRLGPAIGAAILAAARAP
jgi:beta-lactamase class C